MAINSRYSSKQCRLVKEQEFVVIGGRPCKVLELTRLNGDETLIVGRDLFSGGVVEEVHRLSDTIIEPHIERKSMKLLSATPEFCTLEDPSNRTQVTVDFPEGAVADEIEEMMDYAGGEIYVTVASAMGEQGIIACRLMMH